MLHEFGGFSSLTGEKSELFLTLVNFRNYSVHPFQCSFSDLDKLLTCMHILGFPGDSVVKNPLANTGDQGSIPGLGRSPAEGNANSLQYSCLENSLDRGAWWATVHGVAKESDTTQQLNNMHVSVLSQHLKRFACRSKACPLSPFFSFSLSV